MADKTPEEIKQEQIARSQQALTQANNPGLISLDYINYKQPTAQVAGMSAEEVKQAQDQGTVFGYELAPEGQSGLAVKTDDARFTNETNISTDIIRDNVTSVVERDYNGGASLNDLVNLSTTGGKKGLHRVFTATDTETLESYLDKPYQEVSGHGKINLDFIEARFADLSKYFAAKGNGQSLGDYLKIPKDTDLKDFKFQHDNPEHMKILTNLVFATVHHNITNEQLANYATGTRPLPAEPPIDLHTSALNKRVIDFKLRMNEYKHSYGTKLLHDALGSDGDVQLPSGKEWTFNDKFKFDDGHTISHDLFFGMNEFNRTVFDEAQKFTKLFSSYDADTTFTNLNGDELTGSLQEYKNASSHGDKWGMYKKNPGDVTHWHAAHQNFAETFLHRHRTTNDAGVYFAELREATKSLSTFGSYGGYNTGGTYNPQTLALSRINGQEARYNQLVKDMEEAMEMNNFVIPLIQMNSHREAIIDFLNENVEVLDGESEIPEDAELTNPMVAAAINSFLQLDPEDNKALFDRLEKISGGYQASWIKEVQLYTLTPDQQTEVREHQTNFAMEGLQSFIKEIMFEDSNRTGVASDFTPGSEITPEFLIAFQQAQTFATDNPQDLDAQGFTERWKNLLEHNKDIADDIAIRIKATNELGDDYKHETSEKTINDINLLHLGTVLQDIHTSKTIDGSSLVAPNDAVQNPESTTIIDNLRLSVTTVQKLAHSQQLRAVNPTSNPYALDALQTATFRALGVEMPAPAVQPAQYAQQEQMLADATAKMIHNLGAIANSSGETPLQQLYNEIKDLPWSAVVDKLSKTGSGTFRTKNNQQALLNAEGTYTILNQQSQPTDKTVTQDQIAGPISVINFLSDPQDLQKFMTLLDSHNTNNATILSQTKTKVTKAKSSLTPEQKTRLEKLESITSNPKEHARRIDQINETGIPDDETLLTIQALYVAIHDPSNTSLDIAMGDTTARELFSTIFKENIELFSVYLALNESTKSSMEAAIKGKSPAAAAPTTTPKEPASIPGWKKTLDLKQTPPAQQPIDIETTLGDMRVFLEENASSFRAITSRNQMVLDEISYAVLKQYDADIPDIDLGVGPSLETSEQILQELVEDAIFTLNGLRSNSVPLELNGIFDIRHEIQDGMGWREKLGLLAGENTVIDLGNDVAMSPLSILLGIDNHPLFDLADNAAFLYIQASLESTELGFHSLDKATRNQIYNAWDRATNSTDLKQALKDIQHPNNNPSDTLLTLQALRITLEDITNTSISYDEKLSLIFMIEAYENEIKAALPAAAILANALTATGIPVLDADPKLTGLGGKGGDGKGSGKTPVETKATPAPTLQNPEVLAALAEMRKFMADNTDRFKAISLTGEIKLGLNQSILIEAFGKSFKDVDTAKKVTAIIGDLNAAENLQFTTAQTAIEGILTDQTKLDAALTTLQNATDLQTAINTIKILEFLTENSTSNDEIAKLGLTIRLDAYKEFLTNIANPDSPISIEEGLSSLNYDVVKSTAALAAPRAILDKITADGYTLDIADLTTLHTVVAMDIFDRHPAIAALQTGLKAALTGNATLFDAYFAPDMPANDTSFHMLMDIVKGKTGLNNNSTAKTLRSHNKRTVPDDSNAKYSSDSALQKLLKDKFDLRKAYDKLDSKEDIAANTKLKVLIETVRTETDVGKAPSNETLKAIARITENNTESLILFESTGEFYALLTDQKYNAVQTAFQKARATVKKENTAQEEKPEAPAVATPTVPAPAQNPAPTAQKPAAAPAETPPTDLASTLVNMRAFFKTNSSALTLRPVVGGSAAVINIALLQRRYNVTNRQSIDLSVPDGEGTLDQYLQSVVETSIKSLRAFEANKPARGYPTPADTNKLTIPSILAKADADKITALLKEIDAQPLWVEQLKILHNAEIFKDGQTETGSVINFAYTIDGQNSTTAETVVGHAIRALEAVDKGYNSLTKEQKSEAGAAWVGAQQHPEMFDKMLQRLQDPSTSNEDLFKILNTLEISALDPENHDLDDDARTQLLARINSYRNVLHADNKPATERDAAVTSALSGLAQTIAPTTAPVAGKAPVSAPVNVVPSGQQKLRANKKLDDTGAVAVEPKETLYTEAVIQRIKEFQTINGLTADGQLNDATQDALEVQAQGFPLSRYLENHSHVIKIQSGEEFYLDNRGNIYGTDGKGNRDTNKPVGHIHDMKPPSEQALLVFDAVLEQAQVDVTNAFIQKKLLSYENQQHDVLEHIIKDENLRDSVLKKLQGAKTSKEAQDILRPHFKNNDAYNSLTIMTTVLWSIERQRDIFAKAPDVSSIADDLTNPEYSEFHNVAAIRDLFTFFRTGKMESTLDKLRETAYDPSDFSHGIDDRLFHRKVYQALSERKNVKGELVGPEHKGKMLTRNQITEIALERIEQAARDAGIEPGDISKAMLNGDFNPYFEDVQLAHDGLLPDGEMTINPALAQAIKDIDAKYPKDDANHKAALHNLMDDALAGKYSSGNITELSSTRIIHLREIGIFKRGADGPPLPYLRGEYIGTRNQLWNERFGSMENIKAANMIVDHEPITMDSMDLGMRLLQRFRGNYITNEYKLKLDSGMTYDDAIKELSSMPDGEKYAAQLEDEIKEILGRESVVSYFKMSSIHESDFNLRQDYQDMRTKNYLPKLEEIIATKLKKEAPSTPASTTFRDNAESLNPANTNTPPTPAPAPESNPTAGAGTPSN